MLALIRSFPPRVRLSSLNPDLPRHAFEREEARAHGCSILISPLHRDHVSTEESLRDGPFSASQVQVMLMIPGTTIDAGQYERSPKNLNALLTTASLMEKSIPHLGYRSETILVGHFSSHALLPSLADQLQRSSLPRFDPLKPQVSRLHFGS